MSKTGFTIEEERALCAKAQAGDREAMAELLAGFDPLLRKLAAQYSRGRGVLDDNLQSARLGAISAINAFDPGRGRRLCTLIYRCAINGINRSMDQFLVIRLPSNIMHSLNKLEEAVEALEGEHSRPPTVEEIAKKLGVSVNVAKSLMILPRYPLSLDAPVISPAVSTPDMDTLSDFIQDETPTPDQALLQKEAAAMLMEAVESLPALDSEIIKRRFGLSPFPHSQSFNEIGAALGMVAQSVHRAEKRALRTLRGKLNGFINDGKSAKDLSDEKKLERILKLNEIGWRSYEIAALLEVTTAFVYQVLRESDRRSPCSRSPEV